MNITLNGSTHTTSATNISSLLSELNLANTPVLVEHNGTALFLKEFNQTPIQNNDQIEIVQLAAGG